MKASLKVPSAKLLSVLFSAIAVFLSCPESALSQTGTSTGSPLLQTEGTLETGDTVLSDDGSLYDVHTFEGRAGQTVIISLESTQFDTYLLLLSPRGDVIAQNDDVSQGNLNSAIAITLPETGTYQVIANSYDSTGRGNYRLTVRLGQPNDVTARSSAAPGAAQTPVEGVINGDQLVTINGIAWAADGWPFSKVLGIQRDSIDSTIVGRVVLDRHGIDSQPILGIRSPFAGPRPGRLVFVSLWSSNERGCAAELIIQIATTPEGAASDASLYIPTQMEMVINGQRITLPAASNVSGVGRAQTFRYTYSQYDTASETSVNYPGVAQMARHIFPISAEQARILREAPAEDIAVRVTLENRSPITIPIGDRTVERWSSVYSYNPACAPR